MSHRVPEISKCCGSGDHPGEFQQSICLSIWVGNLLSMGFRVSFLLTIEERDVKTWSTI